MLAFLAALDQTASAQGRRREPSDPVGPAAPRGTCVHRWSRPHARCEHARARRRCRGGERATACDSRPRPTRTGPTGSIDLAAGDWQINASKGGYISWQFGQRRPFQAPPPISLAPGQQFTGRYPAHAGRCDFRAHLRRIRRVRSAACRCACTAQRMEQGARRLKAVGVADLTDDTGAFRVYGLPPGDYYVAASLRVAPIDSIVETTYAPTYFPGTGDLAEAQRIKLGLGAEATATFPLLPVRPTRISGVVLNGAGGAGRCLPQSRVGGIRARRSSRRGWCDAIGWDIHAGRCRARALHTESLAAR